MGEMKTEPYRQKLEAEKAKLEEEMGRIGRPNLRVPGDWEPVPPENSMEADLVDQADITLNRETNAAILNDLEARYDSVLAALKRIGESTYGTCTVCGKTIEAARLAADPAATTCTEHL